MPGYRLDKINDDITLLGSDSMLPFTTDAYLLSAFVRRPVGRFGRIAELGAGNGVVSLMLAARGRAEHITAIEIQKSAFEIMEENIRNNGLSATVTPVLGDIRRAEANSLGGVFDAVFANPPYMRAGSGPESVHGEENIARREIFGGIGDFCAAAAHLCRHGGTFYVVFRPERLAELLTSMTEHGLEPKQLTLLCPDADSEPSLVFVAARRGGKPGGLRVTRPLFIYERGGRVETETFRRIYETGQFPEEYTIK